MNRPEKIEISNDHAPLRQRVIRASAWSLGGFGISQAIRFGGNLLMTRLLAPEMFGIMAVATVVMSTLAVLSDPGLRQNVIQNRRGSDGVFLDTIWTIQIVRGIQLTFATLAIAGLVVLAQHYGWVQAQSVYADGRLPYVLAAASASAAVSGFSSTRIFEAGRNLHLKRITLVEIAAQIVSLVLMLAWAAVDRSISALVFGWLGGALVTLGLSHTALPGHRNRLRWDTATVQEVIRFGKWILLGSIIGAAIANADRLMLAGMTDPATLGVYAIAFNMFLVTDQLLMRAVAGIGFSAISEVVRNRPGDLKAVYYKLHAIVALAAYSAFGLLSVLAPTLINLLYDPRYAEGGWMLQILSCGLLLIPSQLALQTFIAQGRPKINTGINFFRFAMLVAAMPVGFAALGLPGALIGLVASSVACIPVVAFYSIRIGFFDWRRELIPLPAIALGMLAAKLTLMLSGSSS